jgi:hypothetical protein
MRHPVTVLRSHPRLVGASALFLLLTAAYSFSVGLRATRGASITADEPFYLLTTQSLLQDGDLDLRQQYDRQSYRDFFDHPDGLWKQSVPTEDGRILSPHEPGLSVLLLPGFALAGLRGAQVEMLLLAALTFGCAYVLVAQEGRERWLPWLVTATVALCATPFVYATEIYPEVPAALCCILSLFIVRRPGNGVLQAVLLILLLTVLAWLGMKYVPIGCLIGLYFLWRSSQPGRAVFVVLAGIAAASYIWMHLAIFDALTAYSVNTVYERASTATILQSHLGFQERAYRLWGLFIDRRFGIGRWAPVFLLVPPALPMLLWRRPLGLLIGGLICLQILMATFVAITMMGWWFPGRTMMTVIPLFPFVLTRVAARLTGVLRPVVAALCLYSLAITLLLVQAAHRGEVTLAVDPFQMSPVLFQLPGVLFPQYTEWTVETIALTVVWVSLGLLTVIALTWRDVASTIRGPGKPRLVTSDRLSL